MSKTPLARAFLSALVDAASPDGSAEMRRDAAAILDSIAVEEALEERLHATLGEVRQRWPDVNLPQDRYFAYVAERATKAANSSIPEQVLRALERAGLAWRLRLPEDLAPRPELRRVAATHDQSRTSPA